MQPVADPRTLRSHLRKLICNGPLQAPSGKTSTSIQLKDAAHHWHYFTRKLVGKPYLVQDPSEPTLHRQNIEHNIICSPSACEIPSGHNLTRLWCMGFELLPEILHGYRSYYVSLLGFYANFEDVVWTEFISADHPLILKYRHGMNLSPRRPFDKKMIKHCQTRLNKLIAELTILELS